MRPIKPGPLAAAVILCLANAAPAFAQSRSDRGNDPPGNGHGRGGNHGVPGPLAGAGLPFLLLAGAAGAYKIIRRRKDERAQREGDAERG